MSLESCTRSTPAEVSSADGAITSDAPPLVAQTSADQLPVARIVPSGEDMLSFEARHVHQIYETIAGHFSSTRYKAWPLVRKFVDELPVGSVMADVGCGNGKNMCLAPHVTCIGCDFSPSLLKIAAAQHFSVVRSDGLQTSFRSGFFDAAISIAVIHHFASRERRIAAIAELLRIVRPDGGTVLIYVWAREQPKLVKKATMDPEGDALIPWEIHKKFDSSESVHGRYYHMFEKDELESLCRDPTIVNTLRGTIQRSYFDKENWCVVLQRSVAPTPTAD